MASSNNPASPTRLLVTISSSLLLLLLLLCCIALPAVSASRCRVAPAVHSHNIAGRRLHDYQCTEVFSLTMKQYSGYVFKAELNGTNNVKTNTTGVLAPLDIPSKGTFTLVVDETGQKAAWQLELCDVPLYVASHLHIGSAIADYAPPLIPLEPYLLPLNPFAPPEQLPLLCYAYEIVGCAWKNQGSFTADDIIPLAGRAPDGDPEVSTVYDWSDFLNALYAGQIYLNIHSLKQPAGIIRGNLYAVTQHPPPPPKVVYTQPQLVTIYVTVYIKYVEKVKSKPPPPPRPDPPPPKPAPPAPSPEPSPSPSPEPSPSPHPRRSPSPSPKPKSPSPAASPSPSPSPKPVTVTLTSSTSTVVPLSPVPLRPASPSPKPNASPSPPPAEAAVAMQPPPAAATASPATAATAARTAIASPTAVTPAAGATNPSVTVIPSTGGPAGSAALLPSPPLSPSPRPLPAHHLHPLLQLRLPQTLLCCQRSVRRSLHAAGPPHAVACSLAQLNTCASGVVSLQLPPQVEV